MDVTLWLKVLFGSSMADTGLPLSVLEPGGRRDNQPYLPSCLRVLAATVLAKR